MRYRSLIAGTLGGQVFEAGSILELTDEAAQAWLEQLCLVLCDDQTVEAGFTANGDEIPQQPVPQADPGVAEVPAPLPDPDPEPDPAPLPEPELKHRSKSKPEPDVEEAP